MKETYTDEEKEKLANILEIEYQTETEEGPLRSEIIEKKVEKATDRLIEIRLVHSKPAAVSRESKDEIYIKFNDTYFDDPLTEVSINQGKPLVIRLPRQLDPATAEAIAATMESANGAANTLATGNLVINILLGSSLKQLWSMINTLQFVVFFTEWNIIIPANALMVIETFRTIALGEFIPYDWLTEPLSEPFQPTEEDEENERSSILSNMGVMLVFLAIIIVVSILIVICVKLCKPGSKLHNLFLKIKRMIFWNTLLRFI